MSLAGLKILLGVTGSIAAYKVCDLIRELQKKGALVRCVMSESATRIIPAYTLQVLSGHPVTVHPFETHSAQNMDHIDDARWADLFAIVPCTANTLGELAHGITQNAVSLTSLACAKPQIIFPAMNTVMLHSTQVQRNLQQLRQDGYLVAPTGSGDLACGELGNGKLLEVKSIVQYLELANLSTKSKLYNSFIPKIYDKKIAVALGYTQEDIDGVRSIVNTSSGLTGLHIAQAFSLFGAKVSVIAGGVKDLGNEWANQFFSAKTTQDFLEILSQNPSQWDGLILSAALSDFIPANSINKKIKNSKSLKNIELKESAKVIKEVFPKLKPNCFSVGFALENVGEEILAIEKWKQHQSKFLVVNTPIDPNHFVGFGKAEVPAVILGPQIPHEIPSPLPLKSKTQLALEVLERATDWFTATQKVALAQ